MGQYHYETDGYRPNNDLEQNIYSGFMQYQFSPNFSAQVEGRYNEFESGDLAMRFRPAIELDERKQLETYSGRLGFHYEPVKGNHFLASVIYRNIEDAQPSIEYSEQSYTAEGQYIYESDTTNLIIGGGQFQSDFEEYFKGNTKNDDEDHVNAYLYFNTKLWKSLTATFGLSFDSYQKVGFKRNQLNPKIGINWQILPSTLIRAAAFQSTKRPLSSNQTLEPTQIAGFNQFFDDFNGSKTKRYGIGLDHQINSSVIIGFEASLREIDYPKENVQSIIKLLTNREQLYRAYFLWAPFETLALKAAYDFEQLKRNSDIDSNNPIAVKTHHVPITLNYFYPNGFFTKLGATFVEQNVKYQRDAKKPLQPGNDHFWIVDVAIGYRLPKRRGILSFGIKNLLDEQFNFEDVNTTSGEPVASQFQPDRMLFGQITLSF